MNQQPPQKEFKTKTNKRTKTNTITQTNSHSEKHNSRAENKEKNISHYETNKSSSLPNKRRIGIGALFFFGSTLIVAIVATLLGGKLDESYQKPPAYAPDWLFPIMWTILYIAIAIASFLAYIKTKDKKKRNADGIWYGINLLFNLLWPLFYFRLNSLILSPICLLLVIIPAIVLTYRYYQAHLASGIIFTLYTIWLLYALYLNLGITMLNMPLNL